VSAVPSIGRASLIQTTSRAAPQAAATAGLYERHAAKILSYCLHQLGSREEAEDAVQTTFMNAFRALGRGVVPESESAWLFKIAENVCLSRRRSSWRRGRIESPSDFDVIEEIVPGPSRHRDELIGIEDALASMPEQQRRAILLREWQGLSYREIADELEVSQSAVETLIFRARRSLAQGLEQPELAKKPKRKSFRRALHIFDFGTLVAAAKTLLAGSAAVKATAAAAVAVTAAAGTAASVTPKQEGHSPKPATPKVVAVAGSQKPAAPMAAAATAPVAAVHETADFVPRARPSVVAPQRTAVPEKIAAAKAVTKPKRVAAAPTTAPAPAAVPEATPPAPAPEPAQPVEQAPPPAAEPPAAPPAAEKQEHKAQERKAREDRRERRGRDRGRQSPDPEPSAIVAVVTPVPAPVADETSVEPAPEPEARERRRGRGARIGRELASLPVVDPLAVLDEAVPEALPAPTAEQAEEPAGEDRGRGRRGRRG
jgi:RNA polymerase sigma factor (sigma-70 family)